MVAEELGNMVQTSQQQVLVAQVYLKTISPFDPNPQTGYMQNSICSLSLENTGTCDLNIRPQFIISNNNSPIVQGDIIIEWYNPVFSFWANIPYECR